MCDKAVKDDLWVLEDVRVYLKTQEMYDKAVKDDPSHGYWKMFLITLKQKKYVKGSLRQAHGS